MGGIIQESRAASNRYAWAASQESAGTQTRQNKGFIEAINVRFQAAKRKARSYRRFATMRTVLFLIAGKLDLAQIKPQAL